MKKIKFSKDYISKLECIIGMCKHDMFDSKCLYNKIVDKKDVDKEIFNNINKIVEKEILNHLDTDKKPNKKKSLKKNGK